MPTLRESTHAVVVLPTLNEELGLDRTLSDLPFGRFGDLNFPVEAVIVDGGSTDRTLEVARKWNIPVLQQTTRGKGAAVLEAIDWVRQQGVPYVAVLDADATYPPEAIVPALTLLREGMDLVVGVRRPVGGPPRSLRDVVHRIGNIALSYAASALSGRTIFDICSGFWAVSTEKFEGLGIGATRFAIEAELVLKALRADLRVAQIPIEYRERLGQAKIHAARDGSAILLSILEFGRRPRRYREPLDLPGIPARQLLSIGLIAESRKAVLEYPANDPQLANRLGLLLHRSLPLARIRIRPAPVASVPFLEFPAGMEGSYILVTLPAPGGEYGARPFSVLIRPQEKELTIRLPPRFRGAEGSADSVPSRPIPRATPLPRPESNFLAGLGTVTTRVGFDPGRQQQTILRANGFDTMVIGGTLAATLGGRP
ncbi:MAG: glycosyltransferase family 2 protein [Thermoplasmata archaeon]